MKRFTPKDSFVWFSSCVSYIQTIHDFLCRTVSEISWSQDLGNRSHQTLNFVPFNYFSHPSCCYGINDAAMNVHQMVPETLQQTDTFNSVEWIPEYGKSCNSENERNFLLRSTAISTARVINNFFMYAIQPWPKNI